MNRIVIRVHPENERSKALPERLGFTHEGTLRECAENGGDLHDLEVHALLRREWGEDE